MLVIEGLLKYSDTRERAKARGKHSAISPWLFIPSQRSGMHAALYDLREYVEILAPEPGGNPFVS
jgi:hypothetical protein